MTAQPNWPVAIIGSGDVGSDLMRKITNGGGPLTMGAMADGIDGLSDLSDVKLVFDTRDVAHPDDWARLADNGIRVLGLTPAGAAPYCVPAVNLDAHLDAPTLHLGTWAAQATVPIVAAVALSGIVSYAEAVSSLSTKSAGPGARADIDGFTESTAQALQVVAGAERAKAVLILNPAEPPMVLRNTVFCLVDDVEGGPAQRQRIETDVLAMVDKVSAYVPGYRLKHRVQFETFGAYNSLYIPETGKFTGTKVTVLLEVAAAADHLPVHAGNIDLITSAAKVTAVRIADASETIGAPS